MASDGGWKTELQKLLVDLFGPGELQMWVSEHYPDVHPAIHFERAPERLVYELVGVFERRGLLDDRFFSRLEQSRPGRRADIQRVRAAMAHARSHKQGETTDSGPRPSPTYQTTGYDVFVSGGVDDAVLAETIAGRVSASGASVFFDRWADLGVSHADAIARSRCVLVLLGPNGVGSTQEAHIAAVRSGPRSPSAPLEPNVLAVRLPGAAIDHSRLPAALQTARWFDLSGGIDDREVWEQLMALVRGGQPAHSDSGQESVAKLGADAPRLRWLHLADLHLPEGRAAHAPLLKAFAPNAQLEAHRPDLIFITGNLVSSPTAAAFEEAEAFIQELTRATGVSPGRVFIVPGDRDRKQQRFAPIDVPDRETAEELLGTTDGLETALGRFSGFSAFQTKAVGRAMTVERPFIAERLRLHGIDLRILGLNSAWADGTGERGWVLGEKVVGAALRQHAGAQLTVVLSHRGLDEVAAFERDAVRDLIAEHDGLLCHAIRDGAAGTPLQAGRSARGTRVARLVELYNDHLRVIALELEPSFQSASPPAQVRLPRPLPALPAVTRPSDMSAEPPDLARYLEHIENEWGYLSVTGLVQAREIRKVPVRGVYCPLQTRHPALGRKIERDGQRAGAPTPAKPIAVPELDSELAIEASAHGNERSVFKQALEADEGTYRPAITLLLQRAGFDQAFASDAAEQDAARARLQTARETHGRAMRALTHIDLETAFARAPLLLVEGEPGSGKTTTLQHVAISLVEAHRGEPHWAERLGFEPPYPHAVIIALREFWAWLVEQSKPRRMGHGKALLLEFVRWKVGGPSNGEAWVEPALQQGRLCLLFDGLDEIPDDALRAKAAGAVRDVVQCYGDRCRIGITTRPAGLGAEEHNALVGRGELTHITIEPLTQDQIRAFARAWCKEIEEKGCEARAAQLIAAVGDNELARHPITLVAMAIVYHVNGELPEYRAKLYEQCAEALAGRWDLRMHDDAGVALAGPVSVDEKLNVLEALAAAIYARGSDHEPRLEPFETAEIVRRTLSEKHSPPSDRAAWDFVQRLADRSGLLTPDVDGRGWRFRHKTFLEYLTARQLCRTAPDAGAALAPHLTDGWWREVILLAVGYEATRGSALAVRMLKTLWQTTQQLAKQPNAQMDALGVVTHAALDARAFGVQNLDAAFAPDWAVTLAALLDDVDMPGRIESRIAVARLLGAVGDPRVGYQDDVHMVRVPEGPFVMGGTDDEAREKEKPVDEVWVSAFRVGRHPVTCAQFAAFVDAGGYDDARWWPHRAQRRADLEAFRDGLGRRPNVPVVEVSWFEAMAYCEWLNHAQPRADGWEYRLPTEAEWEKASRGGLQLADGANPDPRRAYPWGNEFREENAQHVRSSGGIVPIGCHAAGKGPYGCHDQAGNVWEWTLDQWTDNYAWRRGAVDTPMADPRRYDPVTTIDKDDPRVVRGGSFVSLPSWLRVSYRLWFGASRRDANRGFRVVASSLPRTLGP